MMYEVSIPNCYLWMTEGMTNRNKQFPRYVAGYIKQNYPELELVTIKGMTAICKMKT